MLTETLARFVIDTPIAALPRDSLALARDAFVDTLGCGLAGTLEPAGEMATRWARETAARPQATLWGTALSTSPAEAAFANGIYAHALDFDDSLPTLRGHPSAPMVAAALAVGEAARATGEATLAAYVVGLEVGGKLGKAFGHGHYMKGWHTTSTIGTFTATAVAARLWGLDTAGLQTAWGIAASQLSGLVRNFGTMTKPFHAGRAARCGVLSAWLAREGFTADTAIFDGDNNVLATYGADGIPLAEVLTQLGKPWEIIAHGLWVKRWPCCYCNHRAIGGLLEMLTKHKLRTEDVERIEVGFLRGTDTPLIHTNPQTGLEAKFSVEYSLAAALLDRKITLESYTDPMVQRPGVRALMPKVTRYRIGGDTIHGLDAYTDLKVHTRNGVITERVDRTPGSPAWPMTPADREEKFMDCAGRVLGTSAARRVWDTAERCESLADIGELARATAAPQEKTPAGAKTPEIAGNR